MTEISLENKQNQKLITTFGSARISYCICKTPAQQYTESKHGECCSLVGSMRTHLVHMGQQTLLAALARCLTHQFLGVRGEVLEERALRALTTRAAGAGARAAGAGQNVSHTGLLHGRRERWLRIGD